MLIPALEATSHQIAVLVEDDGYLDPEPARLCIWMDMEVRVEEEITLLEGGIGYAGTRDGEPKACTSDGRIETLGPIECR